MNLTDRALRFARSPWAGCAPLALAAAWVVAFGGWFANELLAEIAIFAVLATSMNLVAGRAGMVSLGQAAFFGVGAYAAATLTALADWSAMPAALLGVAVAALTAALVAAALTRVSGVFFIMATLGAGQALHAMAFRSRALGGDDGLPGARRPEALFGWLNWDDPAAFAALTTIIAAVLWWACARLMGSPFGKALDGARINPERMEALGYPVARMKLAAFTLAGALAGAAGAMEAWRTGYVSPGVLHWETSAAALAAVLLGGLGTLSGPLWGATVLTMARHWISELTDYWTFFLGAGFVALALAPAGGLAGLGARARARALAELERRRGA